MKNNLLEKKISCSFYPYRFRKYVFYGFPVINFCNPGVHYETPCRTQTQAVPKRWLTKEIRCVTSQKTEDLNYTAAEDRNQA